MQPPVFVPDNLMGADWYQADRSSNTAKGLHVVKREQSEARNMPRSTRSAGTCSVTGIPFRMSIGISQIQGMAHSGIGHTAPRYCTRRLPTYVVLFLRFRATLCKSTSVGRESPAAGGISP